MAATTAADTRYGRSVRAASVIRFCSPWLPDLSYNMSRRKSSNDSSLRSGGGDACATGGNGRPRAPWGCYGRENDALKRGKTTRLWEVILPNACTMLAVEGVGRPDGAAVDEIGETARDP